ncbi:MAG: hypothetical protein HYT08_03200 [Candidatus Levybacteria bacterium]|nr:hypothetical protein [Candidatus Levybacteria bacterium]
MDEQKDRRGGIVDKTNSAINTAQNLKSALRFGKTAFQIGRTITTAASTSEIWIPAAIIIVIVLIILFTLFMLLGGGSGVALDSQGGSTGGSQPPGGGSGSGDISSCVFYRGGSSTVEVMFGNPQMAAVVADISNRVGVPPAVVAGIMRVESEGAFTRTDPAYLENDYDAVSSGVAYGIMQFTPGTFAGVFTRNAVEMKTLFDKDGVKTTIDPPNNMAPANILRIYSIRDSITAAAFKVKNDKQSINGDGPWDQTTVYEIARRYYGCLRYGPGGCSEGPYNYGEDVWNSYINCQATSLASSCPIKGGQNITPFISCGSFMSDPQYNLSACAGPEPIDRGHCGRSYGVCFQGTIEATNDQRRAHSIDVPASPGTPVYLPTLNNQTASWEYVTSYAVPPGSGGGYGHVFKATVGSDIWDLRLLHLNGPSVNPPGDGNTYKSGDIVTTIASTSFPHVHINIGKNPERENGGAGWLNPEDLGMCR